VASGTDNAQKTPCNPPKAVSTPDPLPPDSWVGKAPKSASTQLELVVDKKGRIHDARVIRSGGSDVDKAAIEGVRQWRFKPATCGNDPIESRIQISVTITLR
jgi:TonB family protein